MGWWELLFGGQSTSNIEELDERIWMTRASKFSGIEKEVEKRVGSDSNAVVMEGHFADALESLDAIIAWSPDSTIPVGATLAGKQVDRGVSAAKLLETSIIDLIVAERHPLLSEDEALRALADQLPCRCRLAYHLSLEDPLIQYAAGWLGNVLRSLGLEEGKSIQSRMVSRRISNVPKQIELQAMGRGRRGAASAQVWLSRHAPEA